MNLINKILLALIIISCGQGKIKAPAIKERSLQNQLTIFKEGKIYKMRDESIYEWFFIFMIDVMKIGGILKDLGSLKEFLLSFKFVSNNSELTSKLKNIKNDNEVRPFINEMIWRSSIDEIDSSISENEKMKNDKKSFKEFKKIKKTRIKIKGKKIILIRQGVKEELGELIDDKNGSINDKNKEQFKFENGKFYMENILIQLEEVSE